MVTRFDRAIPPGGEGTVTLKVILKGYKGNIKKNATIESNDPRNPRTALTMQGKVRTLIDVRPADTIAFRGPARSMGESTLDLAAALQPFRITRVESNLEDKIAHQLVTVEDGKLYRLQVTNLARQGHYSGFLRLHTDFERKSEILIRVNGSIEGEISVKPGALLVGKLSAQQPVRKGRVVVASNSGKPFKIINLVHDEKLIRVTQSPLPDQQGVSLEIVPRMENVPPGAPQRTVLSIETDMASEGKQEVQVQVFHAP
ncbi:MAG TPA: OS_HP3 family (seleno)protein [Syntrophobacteraceae bacterium]|nr:OS_HP3 family (seleno)protein [Syntrophobacteraceae bacterium]